MFQAFSGLMDFVASLKNNNRLKVEVDFLAGATVSKVSITAADTTSDFLNGKLLVSSLLTKTVDNPALAETLTLDLANTAVSAASYGSATQVPTYTVNAKGQLTAAANVSIAIPSSAVTDFTEAVQDTVGAFIADTASIDFTYSDVGNSLSAALTTTGVSAASYGSATQVGSFTVDAQGRLSAASNTAIAIPSTQVTDFTEAAQDAVGAALTDTATIDLAYNDAGNQITANLLSVPNTEVSATADTTTTSATQVLMNAMTATPVSGTYLVFFSTTVESNSNNATVVLSIYANNAQIAHTARRAQPQFQAGLNASDDVPIPISTQGLVTVNGSQTIEGRWSTTGGTATAHQRTLNILKVG